MLETLGMPSASDARYGAPPAASRSPRRCNSSVSVTRSMACWLSPSAIICVKTRRCWSRKKSSARRFSIAAFSAWLSSRIAPSTDRSASRLFGNGFSNVASAGISAQKAGPSQFAFSSLLNHNLRVLASVGDFYFSNEHFLVRSDAALCVEAGRASTGVPVHRFGNLCKTFRPQKKQGRDFSRPGLQQFCGSKRRLRFFLYGHFDLRGDVAEHLDRHLRFPDDLDRLGELHLTLVGFEALRGKPFRNVGGGHRTEHLIVFTGLARELQRYAIQQFGLLLRGLQLGRSFLGERSANA